MGEGQRTAMQHENATRREENATKEIHALSARGIRPGFLVKWEKIRNLQYPETPFKTITENNKGKEDRQTQ